MIALVRLYSRAEIISFVYLGIIDALREGPAGCNVIDNTFAEGDGNLVCLHELFDAAKKLMVASCTRIHLLENCRHVTEYCCI